MRKYFKELDSGADWYKLARLRLGTRYKRWILFLVWHLKYKWKDPHRDEWEERFRKTDEDYDSTLKLYNKYREDIKNKSKKLVNEVLPMLSEFSDDYHKYDRMGNYCSVDEIIKLEHLEGE